MSPYDDARLTLLKWPIADRQLSGADRKRQTLSLTKLSGRKRPVFPFQITIVESEHAFKPQLEGGREPE